MLFGTAYVAQDQGLNFRQSMYIFGITFEEANHEKGINAKCRVLMMRYDSLHRMVHLWQTEPWKFQFPTKSTYWRARVKDLCKMLEIYEKEADSLNSTNLHFHRRRTLGNLLQLKTTELSTIKTALTSPTRRSERHGPLVGKLYIACAGEGE